MNPVKVKKVIRRSEKPICIDELSELCDVNLRHRFFKLSDELFFCEHCGVKRHSVKKVRFYGWFKLLFSVRK